MDYQLIIFDFEGTLCNTKSIVEESLLASYCQLGYVPPTLEAIQEGFKQRNTTQKALKYISPHLEESAMESLLQAYAKNYTAYAKEQQAALFPGVIELFQKLQAHHIKSVIVSNLFVQGLEGIIKYFGLESYIVNYIGAEPNKFSKPDARLYTQYLEPFFPDLSRKNILMVGDSTTDLNFAKAIGIDACWVTYGDGNSLDCRALQPQYTIDQFKELEAILFEYEKKNTLQIR